MLSEMLIDLPDDLIIQILLNSDSIDNICCVCKLLDSICYSAKYITKKQG